MMKRIIYAVLAALMILNGCDRYHPYYDGQEFCLLDSYSGTVLKEDGGHVSVTLQREAEDMFIVEFYGGTGKNHTVTVADPECLDFTYVKGSVKTPPFNSEINPAKIILFPKKLGDTSITVTDDDTGESIQFYVHIGNAYSALSIYYRGHPNIFDNQTVFAFDCGGEDDVFEICRGYIHNLEPVVSGRYSFVDIGGILYFEITYPADSDGRPVAGGEETFRRYQVQFEDGTATDPVDMLWYLNLAELRVQTKDVMPEFYYFRFVDVTSIDESELTGLIDPYKYTDDPENPYMREYPYFNTTPAQYVTLGI